MNGIQSDNGVKITVPLEFMYYCEEELFCSAFNVICLRMELQACQSSVYGECVLIHKSAILNSQSLLPIPNSHKCRRENTNKYSLLNEHKLIIAPLIKQFQCLL